MCGISGYFYFDQKSSLYPYLDIDLSLQSIVHRGPDSFGKYTSPCGRCCLGHVRLSIIDLEGGQQPLSDETGEIQVVVNGELYDFQSIRDDLKSKGHSFKTNTDSEIVVYLYKEYGISFVDHLRGEFAVCIYDSRSQKIILVRDRYSIKPLHYTVINGVFLFASEIKAFLALGWQPEWDLDSIVHHGWLLDDRTCFKGVYKVPASHYVVATSSGTITVQPYWDMDFKNKYDKETRSVEEMIEGVRERLVDSVKQRLVTDVPLAVFLSGGIDSSSIAGIATNLLRQKNPMAEVKAFTVSFTGGGIFDEYKVAKRTADFLGVDMETVALTEDDLLSNFVDSIWHLECPTFNLNTVARYLLARRVQEKGYKVVLTGEGSDEHFGGYVYFQSSYLSEQDYSIPPVFETLSENQRIEKQKETSSGNSSRYMSTSSQLKISSNRLLQYMPPAAFISASVLGSEYLCQAATKCCGTPDLLNFLRDSSINGITRDKIQKKWHPLHSSMYVQSRVCMGNYNLCSVGDRCDMASSIESRTPFLDHHLTEYVNSLPPSVKINGDPSNGKLCEKWILKEAVKPFVTKELYERTKEPFIAPMARGHSDIFVALVDKYLTKESIENIGWLNYETIELTKNQYLQEGSKSNRKYQDLLLLIGFVVLAQKFKVPTYQFHNTK